MDDSAARTTGPMIFDPAEPGSVEMAADLLHAGGILAIPTDTVYGIAASLAHPNAIDRIYAIKQRDPSRPIPVLVSSPDGLKHLAENIDPDVALLLDEFWPGPLTMAIPAPRTMPAAVLAPDGTVGVRMPNHPLALRLIDLAGGAIACTSANISGLQPANTAADVLASIGGLLDGIVDGGQAPGGVPSTVIGISDGKITVHREGAISIALIESAWARLHRNGQ